MESMMSPSQNDASDLVLRHALIQAAISRAAFDGWTRAMLAAAETDAALDAGAAALLFPGGPAEVIDAWALQCDEAMAQQLARTDLDSMKVRARVTLGVRARLEAIGDGHREAARRAAGRLALPDQLARASTITARAADRIWRAIGDRSTDANYYSKRVILSGVIASVLPVWLNAEGSDDPAPWEALDRRIAGVMQFEKTKAQVQRLTDRLPSLTPVLSRLRYPAG